MTWISSKSHQNSIDGRRNFPKSLCQGSWSWCSYPGCSQSEPQTDAWLHYSSRKSSWLKMGGGDHVSRVYPAVVRFQQNRARYLIHLFINVFSKMEKWDVNHRACRVHSHQQHVTIRGAVTFPDMQSTDGGGRFCLVWNAAGKTTWLPFPAGFTCTGCSVCIGGELYPPSEPSVSANIFRISEILRTYSN